ncbi:hypothetical protein DFH05DRAFT_1462788 [Lentinula detonsa]|uniref:Uncharacterized protein n=1 Tax=Lentinula detonsa TaxID=2804962 RepID=A0A9W8NUE6_9AGAR|nr:hypothetical protein DFH05DRAFT_1462788 [Lentinula detonsa]
MSSTQQTPSVPTKSLEWLKRVNANRNTISSSSGITYSITPAELSACLDFDAILRRPGAVLGNLHVPIAYPYLANKFNSDPLIGTMRMAIVDPDTGTIHVPTVPVDRSIFAPFVRGPNSESSVMKTLGLSNLSHKQQALYGKLLLDSAERGVGVSNNKKKGKKISQMNVNHGVKKQYSPMPAGPSTSSSFHPPIIFGSTSSISANNHAVQLGPHAAHNPLHVPNNTPVSDNVVNSASPNESLPASNPGLSESDLTVFFNTLNHNNPASGSTTSPDDFGFTDTDSMILEGDNQPMNEEPSA